MKLGGGRISRSTREPALNPAAVFTKHTLKLGVGEVCSSTGVALQLGSRNKALAHAFFLHFSAVEVLGAAGMRWFGAYALLAGPETFPRRIRSRRVRCKPPPVPVLRLVRAARSAKEARTRALRCSRTPSEIPERFSRTTKKSFSALVKSIPLEEKLKMHRAPVSPHAL